MDNSFLVFSTLSIIYTSFITLIIIESLFTVTLPPETVSISKSFVIKLYPYLLYQKQSFTDRQCLITIKHFCDLGYDLH